MMPPGAKTPVGEITEQVTMIIFYNNMTILNKNNKYLNNSSKEIIFNKWPGIGDAHFL